MFNLSERVNLYCYLQCFRKRNEVQNNKPINRQIIISVCTKTKCKHIIMANINAYAIKWGNLTILNRYLRICHMRGREMISRANYLMYLNNLKC